MTYCKHPDGCFSPVRAKGWCALHYGRVRRTGIPGPVDKLYQSQKGKTCKHPEGCTRSAYVKGWCEMHHSRLQRNDDPGPAGRMRSLTPNWIKNNEGYVIRRITRKGKLQKQEYQHRVVMETHLNRPLRDFEEVHHINGIKDDNRIENLELWVRSQPPGQRAEDLVKWVVDEYEDMVLANLNKQVFTTKLPL